MTNLGYGWTLLGLSTMGTCGGNLLLKQANIALINYGSTIVISPWFVGAIACYILDLILFSKALQYLPVSNAVPVASGIRIAVTAILACIFFGEHLSVNQFLASGLIIVGILFMLRA
ncbi:multidrug efflux SMR transporter [Pleurocapsa sp. PCC 7319]|uniref:DMT family transporter n=1 Tax=Pleurocapsa sp. PCC 7319 TaxID=118161 RepID=UPI00037FDFA6|nr:SMR family transporter [Pleurocapsa sp. PCC 7319]